MMTKIDTKALNQELKIPNAQIATEEVISFYREYRNVNPEKCAEYLKLVLNNKSYQLSNAEKAELKFCYGHCCFLMDEKKRALEIYQDLLPDINHLSSEKYKCSLHINLGVLNSMLKDYGMALHHFFRALDYSEGLRKSQIFMNIGMVYIEQKSYDKALEYITKSEQIKTALEDHNGLVLVYSNLGTIHREMGELDLSASCLEIAIRISKQHQNHTYRQKVLEEKARTEIARKDYKSALESIEAAFLILETFKSSESDLELLLLKADVLLKTNDTQKAEVALQKASAFIDYENVYDQNLLVEYYNAEIELKKQQGKVNEALETAEKLISLQKEVYLNSKSNSISYILEKKEDEIEILEKRNKKIEQQKNELAEYSFIFAHDLKEPIRTVSSFATLLHRRYADSADEDLKEYLDYILDGVGQMDQKLNSLLTYIQIGDDKIKETTNLTELINQVVNEDMKTSFKQTQHELFISELPDLPIIRKDFRTLFFHLFQNALKFKKEDQPLTLSIHAYEANGMHNIMINDNGIGIAEEYQEKIFGLFKRLDRTKNTGAGIGLALCKKVVQMHGGTISVESKEGEGSTFTISLPR